MQAQDSYNRFTNVKEALSNAGLKATQQRLVIYQCLMAAKNHPTAEDIFEQVRPGNPTISLGTVYKTLETLVESKLVQKVPVSENKMRYDARMDTHSHIYCTNTGEIIDYHDHELETLLREYFAGKELKNLTIEDFNLQIRASKSRPDGDITIE